MSTFGSLKERIRELAGQRLCFLPPLIPAAPMLRELFVSEEVLSGVDPPWPRNRTGPRHAAFRATLDGFTEGSLISVSESPFEKPNYATLARTHPARKEIWDLRCTRLDQGMRCFGVFAGKDLFVALTWDYRENIADFDSEVARCRQAWDDLFAPLQPFRGRNLDDYLSNYYVVGKAKRR
jgi:hypothetical protein